MEKSKQVLMAILAHPDDESFGMGGTLAYYASRGADVYLICATRGEAGMISDEYLEGFNSTAERREDELNCAAKQLGLKEVTFLDYRDSGMPGTEENEHPKALINAPLEEVARILVGKIRQIRPDAVLTFDPIGGYRHPDHIHIHQAAVLAFERSADESFYSDEGKSFQPGYLFYHVFPRWFLRLVVNILPIFGKDPRKWGKNKDIDLKSIAEVKFPTHVRIDIRSVSSKKAAASACHASQGGIVMRRGLMGWVSRIFGEHEDFMQAYPPVTGKHKLRKDLLM